MAQPITALHVSEEKKTEQLTALLTENEEALTQMMLLVRELHEAGLLETVTAMLQAKEKLAEIGFHQLNREPVTNFLSLIMGVTGALTKFDPEQSTKLISSIAAGLSEANSYMETDQKVKMLDLLKLLNDPDINRAVGFLVSFLKGMGSGLKDN